MKYLALRIAIALFTFLIGVIVTAQVNRAAYYIWPDVDPQPRIAHEYPQEKHPCGRKFVPR